MPRRWRDAGLVSEHANQRNDGGDNQQETLPIETKPTATGTPAPVVVSVDVNRTRTGGR